LLPSSRPYILRRNLHFAEHLTHYSISLLIIRMESAAHQQTMSQYGLGNPLDVIRRYIIAPLEQSDSLRGTQQSTARPWTSAQPHIRMSPARLGKTNDVLQQIPGHPDFGHKPLRSSNMRTSSY